jgi:hypothetical protein
MVPVEMGVNNDIDVYRSESQRFDCVYRLFVNFTVDWMVVTCSPLRVTQPCVHEYSVFGSFDEPHEYRSYDFNALIHPIGKIRLLGCKKPATGKRSNLELGHICSSFARNVVTPEYLWTPYWLFWSAPHLFIKGRI